jgi:polyphenol oxidase
MNKPVKSVIPVQAQLKPDACADVELFSSSLLAGYPLTCVFTGKPVPYGGTDWSAEEIQQNRQRLCQHLGLAGGSLTGESLSGVALRMPLRQVHGCRIAWPEDTDLSDTDGLITHTPGTAIALQFADCTPVVIYSPTHHVGAVVHAGWRGTAQSIAARAVQQLIERYGMPAQSLLAVIGPAIGGCCFEVGPEVVEALAATLPNGIMPADCITGTGPRGNPTLDLKQINALQLAQQGLTQIDVMPPCTHCSQDTLWSYRRGEGGRQLAVLCLH